MAFNLKATSLVDRVETTDKVIRETLQQFWSGQMQPSGSTGDLARERVKTVETLGRMTRAIVDWGVELLPVRGVFAANETVATSLAMEPKVTPWMTGLKPDVGIPSGRFWRPWIGPALPRWILANAMTRTKDLISWTRGAKTMPNALSIAIRTDPNPYVRLEVLRAIGLAPIPRSWAIVLLDAMTRAEAVLAQTAFTQAERQVIAHALQETAAKLQRGLASEVTATLPSMTLPSGGTEAVITGEVAVPDLAPVDWKPWAAVGGAVALLGGVVVLTRRQHSLALRGPASKALTIETRKGAFVIDDETSASDISRAMSALREEQPRPIAKLYGQRGPTPEQLTAWQESNRAYNRSMSRLRKLHKVALERDNARYYASKDA